MILLFANKINYCQQNNRTNNGYKQTPQIESREATSSNCGKNKSANKSTNDTYYDICEGSHFLVIASKFTAKPSSQSTNNDPSNYTKENDHNLSIC